MKTAFLSGSTSQKWSRIWKKISWVWLTSPTYCIHLDQKLHTTGLIVLCAFGHEVSIVSQQGTRTVTMAVIAANFPTSVRGLQLIQVEMSRHFISSGDGDWLSHRSANPWRIYNFPLCTQVPHSFYPATGDGLNQVNQLPVSSIVCGLSVFCTADNLGMYWRQSLSLPAFHYFCLWEVHSCHTLTFYQST